MTNSNNNHINLHVFVEVESEGEAKACADLLCSLLNSFGKASASQIKPYWKIPEYFDVRLELRCNNLVQEDVEQIASHIGDGWLAAGSSFIWNSGGEAKFADERVRWANLELVEII